MGALPTKTTFVFSVGGDAFIAPRGASPEQSGKTDTAVPLATGRCGHRPLRKTTCVFSVGGVTHKNNIRLQRRGRCPHRPVGCVHRAVRENGHGCTVSIRADVGIGPYKTTCVPSVGGDALIAPRGASPERSGKTDMAVPLAAGRCGHRPLRKTTRVFSVGGVTHKNNVCFQRRGRCPHRPAGGATPERSGKTDTPTPSASGPMWASAPTKNNVRFHRCWRYPQKQRVFSA